MSTSGFWLSRKLGLDSSHLILEAYLSPWARSLNCFSLYTKQRSTRISRNWSKCFISGSDFESSLPEIWQELFMVYIRSISSLPSHCIWGLGFLSPVFLLLVYGYIRARVPELSLCSMEKKKLHLNWRFIWPICQHLLEDDLLLVWSSFRCLHQELAGAGPGVPVLQNLCLVTSPVLLHTQGQQGGSFTPGMGLSKNPIRSWTGLGCTIHQVHPSWGLDSVACV